VDISPAILVNVARNLFVGNMNGQSLTDIRYNQTIIIILEITIKQTDNIDYLLSLIISVIVAIINFCIRLCDMIRNIFFL